MYLVLVSRDDIPIFEMELGEETMKKDLVQFIAHASLDVLDFKCGQSSTMFFKEFDRFHNMVVSGFVTASRNEPFLFVDSLY